MAVLETVMVKGYETLVDPDTKVDVKTGVYAACRLQEMIDSHADQVDWARTRAEMGHIVEVVRAFVRQEQWPDLQAALRGEAPIRQQQAKTVEGVRMVDIDDMPDEDGNYGPVLRCSRLPPPPWARLDLHLVQHGFGHACGVVGRH
jgi:hypothetical protein